MAGPRHRRPGETAPTPEAGGPGEDGGRMRIDKWLFVARFFRSRGLAAGAVSAGAVRVNGERAGRASRLVGAGDVLTFVSGGGVRVVRILGLDARRGPARIAGALYEWISGGPQGDGAGSEGVQAEPEGLAASLPGPARPAPSRPGD